MTSAMKQYSDSPNSEVTELEVFTGILHSRTGVLRGRKKDASQNMRNEFERIAQFIVSQMRHRSATLHSESSFSVMASAESAAVSGRADRESQASRNALELCWACFMISCVDVKSTHVTAELYHGSGRLESFRIVAASCLLKEVNIYFATLKEQKGRKGGGFSGVDRIGRPR